MRLFTTASRMAGRAAGSLFLGMLPGLTLAQSAQSPDSKAAMKTAVPIPAKTAASTAAKVPVAAPVPAPGTVPTKGLLPRAALQVADVAADVPPAAPLSPYELQWAAPRRLQLPGGRTRRLPTFVGAAHHPTTGVPEYQFRVENQHLGRLTLQSARYEAVPAAEAALLADVPLGPEPIIRLALGTETRRPMTLVTVVPLRRNAGTGAVERLLGFDIITAPTTTAARPSAARPSATASVLAQGRWVRFGLTETGVYRIDRTQLQALGIDPAGLDARNLQLWGNGGRMLPQLNRTPRPDDLVENAVLVDETNGAFNALTFFAQGPHGWDHVPGTARYAHEQNLYSDTAYYFLTVGARPGRRVASDILPGAPTGAAVTGFDEHLFYERELVSLLKQGRDWYGEIFDSFTPSREFSFTLDGLDPTVPAQVTARVAGASPNTTSFAFKINDRSLGTLTCPGYPLYDYHPVAVPGAATWLAPTGSIGTDGRVRLSITFSAASAASATGHLDYIELNYRRILRHDGATAFRVGAGVAPGTNRQYDIANCDANTQVWDVTTPWHPRRQLLTLAGSTGSFVAPADSLREFVVLNPGEGRTDTRAFGAVSNQNLHALNVGAGAAEQLDLMIVTHPRFLAQANRLANHRRQHDGLQVAVATTTQVWNEFSSGRADITAIRDLMRLVYDRTTDPVTHPVNLLIFGDASYDYKSNPWYAQRPGAPTAPTPDNTNYVPVYEARQSLDPINAFSSEDYFALLDDTEGEWNETNGVLVEMMDIGVGRLPARDDPTAATFVDKLLRYDAPTSFGRWRNRLLYVTDDADGGEYTGDAETLIKSYVDTAQPAYNVGKLYLDLFSQVSVPSGQRSPDNARAIEQGVDQGALIIDYIGHGGETGWAAERILDIPTINNWRNADRLTFMLTATCEFGRYDDPARSSGAEYAIYNPQGGAVGLFTTTRPVYNTDNLHLNTTFHTTVFAPASDGRPRRIGEVLRRTKATAQGAVLNSRNFALIGDPSMRLAIPELRALVTTINGQPAAAADTLRALTTVQLEGVVQDGAGALATAFTGRIQLTVFDKYATVMTLGDENTPPKPIKVRESILYDGLATVTAGRWTARFVVPRDIAYSYGAGKISLYAWTNTQDAAGANTGVVIGGSSSTVAQDNRPPDIKLFMDDLSFKNGGTTGLDATLIAPLFDDNGINTAGTGIGHDITAILDGNRQNVLVMNAYYTADVDKYQSGTVRYLLKGLAPGPHSLTLKAWDTFNNSAEKTLDFVVANTEGLALNHVLNYPNPFSTNTTFHFDHNRQGDDLDVQVQLFTVTGRLVRTLQTRAVAAAAHVQELTWDGRDEYGDILGRGVYVYKVNARSARDGSHTSKYEKLVILN